MIQHVRPLWQKCVEIEREVREADQKLTALDRKSDALSNRLRDLAENFEEATVDKEEQQEKVARMKQQLQTASELNIILSREFDRNMQVYESVQERIFCLPAACALAAGFLVYLGAYQFPFRRIMLTNNWIKCLHDRGLPLVLDALDLVRGRVVKWQMDSLAHLVANSSMVAIPGEDWKIHFVSEQIDEQLFMGQASASDLNLAAKSGSLKASQESKESFKVQRTNQTSNPEITVEEEEAAAGLREESELLVAGGGGGEQQQAGNSSGEGARQEGGFLEESMLKIDGQPLSQMSRLSEQVSFIRLLEA